MTAKRKQKMICPKCETKLNLDYTYSVTHDGIITSTKGYSCKNCGYMTKRKSKKVVK